MTRHFTPRKPTQRQALAAFNAQRPLEQDAKAAPKRRKMAHSDIHGTDLDAREIPDWDGVGGTDGCQHEYGKEILLSLPPQKRCIKCGELAWA